MVLPFFFRGMGAWRNSTETQQSGYASKSGPEVKNGRSGAEDGAPERLRRGTIQEEPLPRTFRLSTQRFATSKWWCGPRPLTGGGQKW